MTEQKKHREYHKTPGLRYETCRECGLEWNVSKKAVIPYFGYRCPICCSKYKNTRSEK